MRTRGVRQQPANHKGPRLRLHLNRADVGRGCPNLLGQGRLRREGVDLPDRSEGAAAAHMVRGRVVQGHQHRPSFMKAEHTKPKRLIHAAILP